MKYHAHNPPQHSCRVYGFLLLTLAASFVRAGPFAVEEEIEKPHSVSVQWQSTEDIIQGDSQRADMEPERYTLHYGYQFSSKTNALVSVWSGGDNRQLSTKYALDQNESGFSLLLGYYFLPDWQWDIGVSYDETEAQIEQANAKRFYRKESDATEFFTGLSYSFAQGSFDISPAISLTYQKNNLHIEQANPSIRKTESQSLSGMYASTSINLAYLIEGGVQALWVPALSVAWSETLSGEITNTTSSALRNSRLQRTTQDKYEDSSAGSGGVSLSLSLIIRDYFANLSVSRTIGSGDSLSSFGMQVGLDF